MNAYLLLSNGMVLQGESIGCTGTTVGEVVFATGMVGFQETLTDPSYYGQIITQTYPLIGNYGMNSQDYESPKIWAKGYIVREACKTPSNFRCEKTLDAFLKENNTIGIEGVDTRRLTRIIREKGVMNGAITTEFDPQGESERKTALLAEINAYAVVNAVKAVSCTEMRTYNPGGKYHVALMDYGCKANIVRCLEKRGCRVTVMPGTATPEEVMAIHPDGLMLSNGPGDPADNTQIIANIAKMLDTGFLTEEEETAYRRGRNAKTHTKAKNTSLATYEMSTGFEAVFGYLDLAGEEGRVKELIAWCIDEVESEGTREYVFN